MNIGHFAGYLGRDADLRKAGDGQVCNFSVAVSTGWGDKKSTLWVGCSLWGDRGAKLAQYLTKGSAVTVSGDVDIRMYEAKDGSTKAELTCNVQRVTLQGGRDGGREGGRETGKDKRDSSDVAKSDPPDKKGGEDFDEEIPFAMAWLAPLGTLLLAGTVAAQWLA